MKDNIMMLGLFSNRHDGPAFQDGVHLGEGWHLSDATGPWSRRRKTELILLEDHFKGAEMLDLQLQAFGATVAKPQGLTVDGEGLDPQVFTIPFNEPVQISVQCPRFVNGRGTLSFVTEWLESPFAINGSLDDRLLGIRPIAVTHCVDHSFDSLFFGDVSVCSKHAASGWALPDVDGVWQIEDTASIQVSPTELVNVDSLTLNFMVINSAADPLSVTLSHPEFGEASGEFSNSGNLSLQMDRVVASKGREPRSVDLVSELNQLIKVLSVGRVSPHDLGMSEDTRKLGIKLVSLEEN